MEKQTRKINFLMNDYLSTAILKFYSFILLLNKFVQNFSDFFAKVVCCLNIQKVFTGDFKEIYKMWPKEGTAKVYLRASTDT